MDANFQVSLQKRVTPAALCEYTCTDIGINISIGRMCCQYDPGLLDSSCTHTHTRLKSDVCGCCTSLFRQHFMIHANKT